MNYEDQEYFSQSLELDFDTHCRSCGCESHINTRITDIEEIDEFTSRTEYSNSIYLEETADCEDCRSSNVQIYNIRKNRYPCFDGPSLYELHRVKNLYFLEISVSKTQFDNFRKEVLHEPLTFFNDHGKVIPADLYIIAIRNIFKELYSLAPSKFIPLSTGLFNVKISCEYDESIKAHSVSIQSMFNVGLDREFIVKNIMDEFNRKNVGVKFVQGLPR